ncbi:MAG: VWA domain-containing protein [Armatimonadota bacterium]|nr:VWA domain-containing protein [Armatimonadota bacterium]
MKRSCDRVVKPLLGLILASAVLMTLAGCPKKEQPVEEPMMMEAEAPPGPMAEEAAPEGEAEEAIDPDAYVQSTYVGGRGARERLAKLVEEGVVVDGKQVKLAAFSREYSQPFKIPTDRALSLTAETERANIISDGGKTHLQVGLQGIKREAPRRPPLNICLVVDRSGSMGDEDKIGYARKAAVEVVNRLAESDTIAVVAYDDRVQVLVEATKARDKQAIRDRLASLQPGGSTDIHAGLQAGYAQVARNFDAEAINKVMLLSDGMVTAGIADPSAFARLAAGKFDEGIETTAVGMGLDYDEELMMTVAREGKGNYHFIREAAAISDIFREELEELTHLVARALRLRIKLADDVQLIRVLGTTALEEEQVQAAKRTERTLDERVYRELGITTDRQEIEDEPGIKMLIPQFVMGDSHVVMLEIKVPPGSGSRTVADVYLKYKDLVFPANREAHAEVRIEYTGTEGASVASTRWPVRKNMLGFETGEALKRAAALIGENKPGEAARVIDEQMAVLGIAARKWRDADVDRDGDLLAAYKQVIAQMDTRYAGDPELGEYLVKSLTYSAYQRTH